MIAARECEVGNRVNASADSGGKTPASSRLRFLFTQERIPDLLEPLQEQESNLSSLISLASVLLSSSPLPPPFNHPSPSHLCSLSPCGMLDL